MLWTTVRNIAKSNQVLTSQQRAEATHIRARHKPQAVRHAFSRKFFSVRLLVCRSFLAQFLWHAHLRAVVTRGAGFAMPISRRHRLTPNIPIPRDVAADRLLHWQRFLCRLFSLLKSRGAQRRKSGDWPNLSGVLSGGRNLSAPHAPWRGAKFCASVLASSQIPTQSDKPESPDAASLAGIFA